MTRTNSEFLFSANPPWIRIGEGEAERTKWNPSHFYSRPGCDACVRRLRGWKMHTTADLMSEFGAALQFFDGFGENWPALDECLSYLDEWLPADTYILAIERADEVLQNQREDMGHLLRTLDGVGRFWSEPVV